MKAECKNRCDPHRSVRQYLSAVNAGILAYQRKGSGISGTDRILLPPICVRSTVFPPFKSKKIHRINIVRILLHVVSSTSSCSQCSRSAMESSSSWLSSTLPKRTKMPLVTALFQTSGSLSGRNRILSRYGFMSSSRRAPDTKSTCKMWSGSGATAVRYLRSKCVPPSRLFCG